MVVPEFRLDPIFTPAADQPKAIAQISEERFPVIYKTALTAVALRLVWSGASALFFQRS